MKHGWMTAAALWILSGGTAHAFLGVGDITFDPPVHAELISVFRETLALYRAALSEVRRLQEVEAAVRSAQRDINAISNGSLLRYEVATVPTGVPRGMARYLGVARGMARTGININAYYQQQLRRFQNLSRLRWLGGGAGKDLKLSATRLGERTSADVTAQSTAALATLAVARAKSQQRRAIRRAAERRNQRNLPARAAALYRAFGKAS